MMDLESRIKLGHFDEELGILRSTADEAFYESRVKILRDFCVDDVPVLKDQSVDDRKIAVSSLDDRCDISGLLDSTLDVHNEVLEVLSLFGYDNPVKISSNNDSGTDTNNIGYFISRILGMPSTTRSSLIQRYVFSQVHNNDFKSYLNLCYDGKIENFVSDVNNLHKRAKPYFLDNILSLDNFDFFKKDFLKEFGYDNPINISSNNDSHTGTQNIGCFMSRVLGIDPSTNTGLIQKAVFEQLYDNDFEKFLSSCYDGNIQDFVFDINKLNSSGLESALDNIVSLANFDSFKKDILKEFTFDDPINISSRDSKNITAFTGHILGLKSIKSLDVVQQAVFEQLYDNDFKKYLDSCYEGEMEKFILSVKKLNTTAKKPFLNNILSLHNFGNFKKDFLKEFGYDNPINIYAKSNSGVGTGNIGYVISRILEVPSTTKSSLIQKYVFEQLYDNDFETYLDSCYDGNIQDFVSDLKELSKTKKNYFLDNLLSLDNFDSFKKDFLKDFGYDNPMNIASAGDTNTNNVGGLISKVLGIDSTNKSGPIQKSVFEQLYDNDFKTYLDSCYDGSVKDFISDLKKLHKSSRPIILNNIISLDNFDSFKKDFLFEFGFDNPINISYVEDSKVSLHSTGYVISRILGIKSTRNPSSIQKSVFSQLYNNNFATYLNSCYDSNIDTFKEDFNNLKGTGKSLFWDIIHNLDGFSQYQDSFMDFSAYYEDVSNVKKGLDIIIGENGSFPSNKQLQNQNPALIRGITKYHKGLTKVKIKLGYANKELDILKQIVDEVYDES